MKDQQFKRTPPVWFRILRWWGTWPELTDLAVGLFVAYLVFEVFAR